MMRNAIAAALTVAGTVFASAPGLAQDVTLSSPGGGLSISGRLLGYDGTYFRVDSVYGVLTLDASRVTCSGARCPGPGPFVAEFLISGAKDSSSRLMPMLLEAYAAERGLTAIRQEEDAAHLYYVIRDRAAARDVARVRFRLTSSAEGFADLLAETASVALSFREPTEAERERALGAGFGDLGAASKSGILALDALVAVVAQDNPVREISLANLARVISGEITDWTELGGPSAPIQLHLPEPGSALDRAVSSRILDAGVFPAEPAVRHRDPESLSSAIAEDRFALGVTSISGANGARMLALSGACGARIAPAPMSVKTEDYPLTVPHYIFTTGLSAPAFLREFLAFTRSSEAQDVVRDAGFVDQAITLKPLADQGDRLAQAILGTGRDVTAPDLRRLVRALEDAAQLSLSFRFQDGSADLDAPSRANVEILARAIADGRFDGGTILLAGFSDGQGNGETNRGLSLRRAEAVRNALLDAVPDGVEGTTLDAAGFGEAMPLACDDLAWGRQANRRVEVWYQPERP